MNYDIIAKVSLIDKPCVTDEYKVWDHFGTLTVTEATTLSYSC